MSSLYNRAKNKSKNFASGSINIWLNFIFILTRILKKQLEVQRLMYSNVYDDITDFEVCGFTKNTNI